MTDRENEIMKKYEAFIKPMKGPQETLMCFGFECGTGWYGILERLFEAISKLDKPENFEIVQVKEKFGGLRVYTNYSTDEIEALITEAEKEADNTCEICGEPGTLCTNGGWLKTMCETCMNGKEGYYKYEENTEKCEGEE